MICDTCAMCYHMAFVWDQRDIRQRDYISHAFWYHCLICEQFQVSDLVYLSPFNDTIKLIRFEGKPKVACGFILNMEKNCSCKKSGCTKNYCRCYDQKKLCGPSCRCISKGFYYYFNFDSNIFSLGVLIFFFFVGTDCQNRLGSTSRSTLPDVETNTNPPPQSGRKRFFDAGEFDRCANSLMSVARTCLEQKVDKDVAHRRLLESFSGELDRLQRIVDEKKNHKM